MNQRQQQIIIQAGRKGRGRGRGSGPYSPPNRNPTEIQQYANPADHPGEAFTPGRYKGPSKLHVHAPNPGVEMRESAEAQARQRRAERRYKRWLALHPYKESIRNT